MEMERQPERPSKEVVLCLEEQLEQEVLSVDAGSDEFNSTDQEEEEEEEAEAEQEPEQEQLSSSSGQSQQESVVEEDSEAVSSEEDEYVGVEPGFLLEEQSYNPAFDFERREPKDLVWLLVNNRWYASIIKQYKLWYINYAVHKDHPDRGVVTNWINEGRRTATMAVIVSRNSSPGGNFGWHQPITRTSLIKKEYGKFLLERIMDTHQLIAAEKRGLCHYCKSKMLYFCKGCNTKCCLVHPKCIQQHWYSIYGAYDYFKHQSLPRMLEEGVVSLAVNEPL